MTRLLKTVILLFIVLFTPFSVINAITSGDHCEEENGQKICDEDKGIWYWCLANKWEQYHSCSPGKCKIIINNPGYCDYTGVVPPQNNIKGGEPCDINNNFFICDDNKVYTCHTLPNRTYTFLLECLDGCDKVGYFCNNDDKSTYCSPGEKRCSSDLSGFYTCDSSTKWSQEITKCLNSTCDTSLSSGCKPNEIPPEPIPIEPDPDNLAKINLNAPEKFSNLGKITINSLITSLITILLIVTSFTFFFTLLFGGLKWITSSGDEKKVAAARSQITHGLIGLSIVFSAWAVMSLLKSLFGINFTSLSIPIFY